MNTTREDQYRETIKAFRKIKEWYGKLATRSDREYIINSLREELDSESEGSQE